MGVEAGHAEQRRLADPAAEHGVRCQPFGPPCGGLAGLVLPRSAERLGVTSQAFETEIAIGRGVICVEAADLAELLRGASGWTMDPSIEEEAYDATLRSPKACASCLSIGATASLRRAAAASTLSPAVSTTALARA